EAAPATSARAAAAAAAGAAPAAADSADASAHTPADLARRVVTALVFAAKADGHIDDAEQKAISDKMSELNLGPQTQDLVQQAMNAPLDPALIADGVTDPELAMQLFMLSCSVIDVDHFMERSYLAALAEALHIPKEMMEEMEEKVRAMKQ
ncbi:tellurite resistance TerB family protein, partial [Desulfovibrio sp. OttesenSCG-928-G15]|nr:tellurite resistance TerB family protein [Desulfovibrio sp. OttesenSCG-928-G15]